MIHSISAALVGGHFSSPTLYHNQCTTHVKGVDPQSSSTSLNKATTSLDYDLIKDIK